MTLTWRRTQQSRPEDFGTEIATYARECRFMHHEANSER